MTRQPEWASLRLDERIAAVWDASGLDQPAFAAEAGGVANATVSRWVHGKANPERPNRHALARLASRVYGEPVSPDVFMPVIPARERSLAESLHDLQQGMREQTAMVAKILELLLAQQPSEDDPSEPGDQQ